VSRDLISKCRSCGREIVWTLTEKGKKMPCDLTPTVDTKGAFFLFRRGGYVEAIACWSEHPSAVTARSRCNNLYPSHFSTCPHAGEHRRRG